MLNAFVKNDFWKRCWNEKNETCEMSNENI